MRTCDCIHLLFSLTVVVLPLSYKTKQEAQTEAIRKSGAGETLSEKETKYMTGYSNPTPYWRLARPWSLVRRLQHAHL